MMLIIFRNLNILLQINNPVSLKQVSTLVVPTENSYYTLLMTFGLETAMSTEVIFANSVLEANTRKAIEVNMI